MKVLITGTNGMLGSVLSKLYKDPVLLNGRKDLDLTCSSSVKSFFINRYFDTIIHCAAYTNLNWCDDNLLDCYQLHSTIVPFLQKYCKKLIYISTNPTESKRIYYHSKRLGEEFTLLRSQDLAIRTNIYGNSGLVQWAVDSLRNKKNINGYSNVMFNPVSVYQLSNFIKKDSKSFKGIVNVSSDKVLSKYAFILEICEKLNLDKKLISSVRVNGDLDLTIPQKEAILYSHKNGIKELCKKLTL